jgi:hypothetical protein
MKETCELTLNGIPYSDIQKMDLCTLLQEYQRCYNMVDFMMGLSSYQPRAVNSPTSGFQDCDINHPAEIFCFIRNDVPVARILFTCFSRPFRATCTGAASGGASVQTSSSTSASADSHAHIYGLPTHHHTVTSIPQYTSDDSGHHHTYYAANSVSGDVGGSDYNQTSSNSGSHNHQVDVTMQIPEHQHNILFGIYEFPYYAGVELHINSKTGPRNPMFGQLGDENNYFDCALLELTSSLHAPYGLEEGVNLLYVKPIASPNNPLGLIRIFSEVMVQYRE